MFSNPRLSRSGKSLLTFGLLTAWALITSSPTWSAELPDFASLVKKNAGAVVNIATDRNGNGVEEALPDMPEGSPLEEFFERFTPESPRFRESRSLGSGFIVSADGYIITAAHVIEDADRVIVRLADREELEAEVVGQDPRSDVALLKVNPGRDLPIVEIGSSANLEVGEWVLAIGSPFGFESTATAGIVSAKSRSLPSENYVPFIQTDVAINPGNSGGPLFDVEGRVVGLNAQIFSRTGGFMGLSFAVPIDMVMSVSNQLREFGRVRRGWLGVGIQTVTADLADSFGMDKPIGALVTEVFKGSPASGSEILPGDIIVAFNDAAVNQMSELPPLVGATPVGDTVPVVVVRDGEEITVEVTIGELSEDPRATAAVTPAPAPEADLLGLTVAPLEAGEKSELGLKSGVKVTGVEDGPAARAGIQPGDILLRIGREDIDSAAGMSEIIANAKPSSTLPILVRRGDSSTFLVVQLD